MWESICLTLMATAGNNIGKVLQKKGTVVLPPLSLKPKVLKAYLFNTSWIIGFVMDMVGAAFMLKALSLAPVSIIQPVSGCGLAILAIFSYFYLKEVMNALDWIGIVLAGIGTIGVGIGGEEQRLSTVSLLRLPWLVFSITILFVLLNAWLHIYKSKRRDQELLNYEVVEEIISGLESGILFGLASVISKLGFIFFEQGFSKILIPICISISICCSAFGFFCQESSLTSKHNNNNRTTKGVYGPYPRRIQDHNCKVSKSQSFLQHRNLLRRCLMITEVLVLMLPNRDRCLGHALHTILLQDCLPISHFNKKLSRGI